LELVQTAVEIVLGAGLALMVFAFSMRAGKEDFDFVTSERRLFLISLLSIFVLAPTVAIAVIYWVEPPLVVRVAIASMSISIIPPLMPWKQLQARGDQHYAVGLTLAAAILAVFFVPAGADLLGRINHHPYGVPPGEIASYVFIIVVLPFALGIAVGYRWKGFSTRIAIPLIRIGGIGTLIATGVVLISAVPDIPGVIGTKTLLAMILFNVLALGIGHLLGGPDPERATVLGLSTASRHPAVALTIASVNYPGEKFTAAVMLCVAVNLVVTTPYLRWQTRRYAKRDPEIDPDTIAS
jgi:BASS family bile acid:Na+ symporter